MRLSEVVERLDLKVLCGGDRLSRDVGAGYVSDLMSDVIAHAREGAVWVTVQTHMNIVAIAVMRELAAILLAGGREPEPQTLARAVEQGVTLLSTPLPAFEVVGRLHGLGLGG
jgi:predicted transcriptional regulator